jgi:hypothetical protein
VFQSEVLIGEANFLKAFPGEQGYRVFLIDAPKAQQQSVIEQLETALTDYGFDASLSASRLAGFHRVENTYLSTFQLLGALGLLLGTVGLAAVLIRNVLERRQELSLLSAVGYSGPVLKRLVLRENTFILIAGLGIGTICAVIAILPALGARDGSLPMMRIGMLLAAVFAHRPRRRMAGGTLGATIEVDGSIFRPRSCAGPRGRHDRRSIPEHARSRPPRRTMGLHALLARRAP